MVQQGTTLVRYPGLLETYSFPFQYICQPIRNELFRPWIFTEILTKVTIVECLFLFFVSCIVTKSYIHMIVFVYCYFT